MKSFVLTTALSLAMAAPAAAANWTIDGSHSTANFSVRHMMISNTTGTFTGIKGKVDLNDKDLTRSSIDVTIDATTIDTNDAKRDGHLKAADFLDVGKHPTMRFKAKRIKKSGKAFKVVGDLSIRGKTKEVTLDAQISAAQKHPFTGKLIRGVTASTVINRHDFGVSWNKSMDKGGVVVGDDVKIELNIELIGGSASGA